MTIPVRLSRDLADKKWKVELEGRTVRFGAKGYEDYTMHGDDERRQSYLQRHRPNQNWTKNGRFTAGFWARWLLWEKPSMQQAIEHMQKKFGWKITIASS